MSDREMPTGWALLHSKLPSSAIKPLSTSVYGVAGLSDVNEGYLIRRLFGSQMLWEWRVIKQEYLGFEDRVSDKGKEYRVYMAAVHGELIIEGRGFHGSGASDNRKLDAAYKGAATVAFKNACKWAGLTAELFLDGRSIDLIYSERIRKDSDMVPETVQGLVEKITETYGDPLQAAQQDERPGAKASAETPSPAMTPAAPLGPDLPEGVQGANDQGTALNLPAPAPASPSDDEMADLFALARTLKTPATHVYVTNEVAKNGIEAVRRRLILAHAEPRNCGKSPCIHVAQLAGMHV